VKVRKFASPDAIEKRYEEINQFEKQLTQNGTTIIKIMLNLSKDEQRERMQERIDKPEKRWKFNPGDLEDRKLWDDYMTAYEMAMQRCSTAQAPWYVVPADRNWVRNGVVARIVRDKLEEMNPQYPEPKGWDPMLVKIL